MNIYESIKQNLKESNWYVYQNKIQNILDSAKQIMSEGDFIDFCDGIIHMCQQYTGDLSSQGDIFDSENKDLKESSGTTSLNEIKELAGYLQDFIDGCEKRNMHDLKLEGSHLAGDCLCVAGQNGGYISLNSDLSYDDDEIFSDYDPNKEW